MSNFNSAGFRMGAAGLCALALLHTGCASRLAMTDDQGKPISRQEVETRKSNTNFLLYTVGGGALSFGASFFAGSMIERGTGSDNRTALWTVTGVGTVAGLVLFSHAGRVRDFNLAVESVRDERRATVDDEIGKEKAKQEAIAEERKKLEEERKRQEQEREKLLRQIREKQSKENNP